jgi:hypothetical protein
MLSVSGIELRFLGLSSDSFVVISTELWRSIAARVRKTKCKRRLTRSSGRCEDKAMIGMQGLCSDVVKTIAYRSSSYSAVTHFTPLSGQQICLAVEMVGW